ncbi:MAG: glycosyltransferase family 4 protein [Pseudomonadota bacterium]
MKPKVAFIVQRYGPDINGGAEYECRQIAELMNDVWEIDVLTTCANDYMTWKNFYPKGKEIINGVSVHRFPVREPRNVKKFNRISEKILHVPHNNDDEIQWMKAQGPDSPEMLNYLDRNKPNYDIFIFFTYLYATTFWGLPLVSEKSILVPTAHDEPPIYLSMFREFYKKPKGFVFNTLEEKQLLLKLFDIDYTISDIIGIGINPAQYTFPQAKSPNKISTGYVVYVGRVDASKGCRELFKYWEQYKEKNTSSLKLLLVGGLNMEIPKREDIVSLGFVPEQEKNAVMANAECLIMPSPYESLSIVLLEAWLCGIPVLVNGKCPVLKGQVRRSNGGLWYDNYNEFEACLAYLLQEKEIAGKMASAGRRFTEENYHFPIVKKKYQRLADMFSGTF